MWDFDLGSTSIVHPETADYFGLNSFNFYLQIKWN